MVWRGFKVYLECQAWYQSRTQLFQPATWAYCNPLMYGRGLAHTHACGFLYLHEAKSVKGMRWHDLACCDCNAARLNGKACVIVTFPNFFPPEHSTTTIGRLRAGNPVERISQIFFPDSSLSAQRLSISRPRWIMNSVINLHSTLGRRP